VLGYSCCLDRQNSCAKLSAVVGPGKKKIFYAGISEASFELFDLFQFKEQNANWPVLNITLEVGTYLSLP